jgi:threonine aldolase
VNELERRTADLLGKEAALFVPSGTMSNQIAVRIHCRPQDEVLLESRSHIYLWEAGGPAALSGVTQRTIDGRNGILELNQLEDLLHPDDMHSVRSRLVCIENTHNRGGGTVQPLDGVKAISNWAHSHGLAMHLDGARLWNAIVASGIPAKEWSRHFDTVSVCFSKGLGAPVGSALAGPKDLIAQGRRVRKLFGGAMRQAGYLAAACQYAMERHVDRLAEDHANAKRIAAAIAEQPGLSLASGDVQTNLIWIEVGSPWKSARDVAMKLKDAGILVSALGAKVVRACTHLDASAADCTRAADAIRALKP